MNAVERWRATHEFGPVDHLYRKEFSIWPEAIERWKAEGMPADLDRAELFGYDSPATASTGMLGWCDPAFVPQPKQEVLDATAEYEIVRDASLRTVKVYRGRRHGFMPTYLKHAVTCERDWREDALPRLMPDVSGRWAGFEERAARLVAADAEGKWIVLNGIGGYMYLRALIGPTELMYMLVDSPGLIHEMMRAWLALGEAVAERVQQCVEIDEFFIGEDSCYNHGLLISPAMMREFILPYYVRLLDSIRARQRRKKLRFHVDTDGRVDEAIDLYLEAGMTAMSPFEIAADCDVVAIARRYPKLMMHGGIDKRVLALGPEAIDEYLRRVIPPMVTRGGYIPTCDHGVPDNVSYESYRYYRKRMLELDH